MRRPGSVGSTASGNVRARALTIGAVCTLVVGGVLVLTETAAHAVNEECAPQGAQVLCGYNNSAAVADFKVPAGVHSVEVALIGGRGGNGWENSGSGAPGGTTATTLTVIPGQILGAWVGGAGGTPSVCAGAGVGGRSGGPQTGGNGGAGDNCDAGGGGGGGGGSFITNGLTLSAAAVLAAAGGGGGGAGNLEDVDVLPASMAVGGGASAAPTLATDDGGAGGGSASGPQPGTDGNGGDAAGVPGIIGGPGTDGGGGGGSGAPRSGSGGETEGGGGGGCGMPGPCVQVEPEDEESQYRATQTSPIEISYIPPPGSGSGPSGHGGPSSNDPNPNTNPGADPQPLPGMDPATATARCKPEKKICTVSVAGPDSRFKIDAEDGSDPAILFATMYGNWRPASVEASGKPNCPNYTEQNSDWVQFGFFEPERGKTWHKTAYMTQRQKMKRGAAEALAQEMQVCFAAPYKFPTRPGYRLGTSGADRVGVLPECGSARLRTAKARAWPCVDVREIVGVKGGWVVRLTFKVPASSQDPKALG